MRYVTYASLLSVALMATSCHQRQNDCVVTETYVHKYGCEVSPQDWASRGEHGQVITTLKNGVVVAKTYDSGVLDGDTTYTFPHSQVIEKTDTYTKGYLQKSVTHYLSGRPAQQILYSMPDTQEVTLWYENGAPQAKQRFEGDRLVRGEYYTIKNQLEAKIENGEGTRVQRDIYGQMIAQETFKNGEMVLSTTFHPNGAPKELTPYAKGIISGTRKTYLPGGEPNTIEEWVGGKLQGVMVVFQNGEKYAEIPYVDGRKNGVEKRYRDGKAVVEEVTWVEGLRQGPNKAYIGDIVKTEWYYQDKPVSKVMFDHLNQRKM